MSTTAVSKPRPHRKNVNTDLRDARAVILLTFLTVALALGCSALLVLIADGSPSKVVHALVEGSVGSKSALAVTINQAAPILIVALASIASFRAGLVNIGAEGQLVMGGMMGAWLGLNLGFGGALGVVGILLASALGGAMWAGVAALMQYTRNVNVVISTLLLNFVAYELLSLAVSRAYWLQETTDGEYKSPQSDRISGDLRLPRFGWLGLDVHVGFVIALALAGALFVLFTRTTWGLRVRMLGLNAITARTVGVNAAIVGGSALLLSGAMAGLAGGVMLTGTVYRVQSGFSNKVGWDGLLAGLVARRNPIVAIPAALFFGALRSGGGFLAATGVPRLFVDIVQALLVLAVVLPPVLLDARRRRSASTRRTKAED